MPIQLDLIDFNNQLGKPVESETGNSIPAEPERESNTEFEADVSRAVHSALIMRPIYELENLRIHQTESEDTPAIWHGVDVMWVAFAILDVIAELTEYQIGATRSEIMEKVLPAIRKQAVARGIAPMDEGLSEVLKKIFDHLVNRKNRYLRFHYPYFDGASDAYQTRSFWLIKTVYTGEGGEALFALTDEGYTAYFGLHETSALDAAAIGNLRIKLLIERGKVDDAISAADENLKQCTRKALDIRNIRRQIRRNISGVDFNMVETLADEGVNQVKDIQEEAYRLYSMVAEHLLPSQGEKHGTKLCRLAELLEKLSNQLLGLAGELQNLPEDYHNHSHKLFRRPSLGLFPSMEEVMGLVFCLNEDDAAKIGTEFIARIDPPVRRPIFSPATVIEACDRALDRQNVHGDYRQSIVEIDEISENRYIPELDDAVMQEAYAFINTQVQREGEILLSTLLENAAASGNEDIFPTAVAMGAFQCMVIAKIAAKYHIQAEVPALNKRIGVDLSAERRYRGHELILKYRSDL